MKLPQSLALWRCPPLKEGDDLIAVWEAVWEPLRLFFGEHGYTLWQHDIGHILTPLEDNEDLLLRHNGGFAYVTAHRGVDSPTGSLEELLTFERLVCLPTNGDTRLQCLPEPIVQTCSYSRGC